MSYMIRLQFSERPRVETIGSILAQAALDGAFEDSDVLEDS